MKLQSDKFRKKLQDAFSKCNSIEERQLAFNELMAGEEVKKITYEDGMHARKNYFKDITSSPIGRILFRRSSTERRKELILEALQKLNKIKCLKGFEYLTHGTAIADSVDMSLTRLEHLGDMYDAYLQKVKSKGE